MDVTGTLSVLRLFGVVACSVSIATLRQQQQASTLETCQKRSCGGSSRPSEGFFSTTSTRTRPGTSLRYRRTGTGTGSESGPVYSLGNVSVSVYSSWVNARRVRLTERRRSTWTELRPSRWSEPFQMGPVSTGRTCRKRTLWVTFRCYG